MASPNGAASAEAHSLAVAAVADAAPLRLSFPDTDDPTPRRLDDPPPLDGPSWRRRRSRAAADARATPRPDPVVSAAARGGATAAVTQLRWWPECTRGGCAADAEFLVPVADARLPRGWWALVGRCASHVLGLPAVTPAQAVASTGAQGGWLPSAWTRWHRAQHTAAAR